MSIDAILQSINSIGLARHIQMSEAFFPNLEALHVLGITLLFGSIVLIDLRLLGVFGRERSYPAMSRDLIRWTWLGFAIALITGGLMFISNAAMYFHNTQFQFKLLLLALAGINMLILEFRTIHQLPAWDGTYVASPPAVRLAAALSLTFWTSILILGRWVGFTLSPPGFGL